MVERGELLQKTAEDLFGPGVALIARATGQETLVRVASNIGRIQRIAAERGFKFLDFKFLNDDPEPYMYVVCENEGRESVVFHNEFSGDNQGIWVPEEHFDIFQELIGVEEDLAVK